MTLLLAMISQTDAESAGCMSQSRVEEGSQSKLCHETTKLLQD